MSTSFASPMPEDRPVLYPAALNSLYSHNFGTLKEERDLASKLRRQVVNMSNTYDDIYRRMPAIYEEYLQAFREAYNMPEHPLSDLDDQTKEELIVTPDKVLQILRQTDHTTLSSESAEDRVFMERMSYESSFPFDMKAICSRPEKMELIVDFYRRHPEKRIAVVTGFSHSAFTPDNARREIQEFYEIYAKNGLKNPIDIDTVAHYLAWMSGERDLVRAIFESEAQACKEIGATWKTILKSDVHAYAEKNVLFSGDTFGSIMAMGTDAMEAAQKAGLKQHYLKTCTGQPAAAPFNNFVPADVAYPELTLPMFIAASKFNTENGTSVMCKVSGGNLNEKDAVAYRYLYLQTNGPELLNHLVLGAGPNFRDRLLHFVHEMRLLGAPGCDFDRSALNPYGIDMSKIPTHELGLPSGQASGPGTGHALRPDLTLRPF